MSFRRRRTDDDFHEEIRAHIALETDRLIQEGVSPGDARAAAHRAFGNVLGARDRFHDAHYRVWLEQFARDLRYAWRGLWRSRAFCATTVLTLAVGLGLATAVFTIFNAYVLRPFAVRDPYSVHEITWHSQEAAGSTFRWSDYEALRARTDLFEAVIAQANRFVTSQGNTLSAGFVSGNYFAALGAPVLLGRGLADYDARADGGAPVAVLGYRTWARLFDRDPAVLGREIEINDRKLVIVGVTREEFQGLDDAPQDLWVPVTMYGPIVKSDLFAAVQPREMHLTARLRRTVTGAQAEGAVSLEPFEARVAGRLDAVRAEFRVRATPVRLTLELLAVLSPVFTAFGLVLVAACANASNVMLARANARHREIGIRLSLGASRGRVIRQLLTEGLLISVLAGAAGLALAAALLRAGTSLFFRVLPSAVSSLVRVAPLDFDLRVFVFALVAATCATLLFALLPALQATRLTLTDALRGEPSPAVRSAVLRSVLVGGQVAVSLVLLVVAATLVRNGVAIGATDLGLDTRGVTSVNQRGQNKTLTARAFAALAVDPRIDQIVVTSRNPLFGQLPKFPVRRDPASAGQGATSGPPDLEPHDRRAPEGAVVAVSYMFVSPEYFPMLAIPIVRGRGFLAGEAREESGVAIVSAAGAQLLWPGDDPIGKTLRVQVDPPSSHAAETVKTLRPVDGAKAPDSIVVTIVGVAKDVVSGFVYEGKDAAHVYLPTSPAGPHAEALLVRGRPGASLHGDTLRTLLQKASPDPLVFETVRLQQMVDVQMFPLRAASWIGSFLALMALALSVSGLYGVLTYTIGQRAREIGIRMALGATAAAVVRLVMRQSARLAGLGAAVGLLFAYSVMKVLSTFVRMENVSVVDAGAFAVGLSLVAIAVALASYAPARRAARVDPSLMLRSET
jgi:putative ABC transport system permease protein